MYSKKDYDVVAVCKTKNAAHASVLRNKLTGKLLLNLSTKNVRRNQGIIEILPGMSIPPGAYSTEHRWHYNEAASEMITEMLIMCHERYKDEKKVEEPTTEDVDFDIPF